MEGILSAIATESHIRFHLVAGFYVFLFAFLGRFNTTEWAVLIVTVCAVLCSELLNTAMERLCDLYTTEENKNIKFIKDVAAGAVLVFAVGAAAVALCLFVFTGKLADALHLITVSHPLLLIPLCISAVLSVIFVTKGFGLKRKSK